MAILITQCTRTSIPRAPNQQEFMASLNYTRILEPTLLRHFAPSCLLLEHIIITRLNIFAIFYRRTFQLNIVLLTLSLFVQDIQSLSMFGKFMVSINVESLFTNILREECIDLTVNYISEGNPELRSLFTVATAQTHFLFNGSFYDQITRVVLSHRIGHSIDEFPCCVSGAVYANGRCQLSPLLAKRCYGDCKYRKLEARVKKLEDALCDLDLDCKRNIKQSLLAE